MMSQMKRREEKRRRGSERSKECVRQCAWKHEEGARSLQPARCRGSGGASGSNCKEERTSNAVPQVSLNNFKSEREGGGGDMDVEGVCQGGSLKDARF